MTRRERIQAALVGDAVDRVPYVFWRRFPSVDRSPSGLAQATLRFHERYGADLLVLVPPAGAPVAAWGCEEADELEGDGTRACRRCAVREPADWRAIRPVDPATAPGFTETLESIVRLGFDRRIGDAPVLLDFPSPDMVVRRLSGSRLPAHLAVDPGAVAGALAAVAETLVRFAEIVLGEGLAGLLYTTADAGVELAVEPHERRLLETVRRRGGLTLVHAAGPPSMLARVAALPVDAVSWTGATSAAGLDLLRARGRGAVAGGVDRQTLRHGTPDAAREEALTAVAAMGGRGLIIAPDGPLLPGTPDAPVAAIATALGGRLRPLPGVAL